MAGLKIGHVMSSAGALTDIDTKARNALGSRCFDDAGSEFIYLQGVASTVACDWVVYGLTAATPFQTARAVHTTANTGPVAIALAAVLAANFGWYQIYGSALGNGANDTFAANHFVYLTSTAGVVDDDVVAADIVYNASSQEVGAAVISKFWLNYPYVLGIQPA
jgi:hypothetical protein